MIIARRKQFFRGTLANFCKSKKCIIFNVHYRPGSKKSKFDIPLLETVLLRHYMFMIKEIFDENGKNHKNMF